MLYSISIVNFNHKLMVTVCFKITIINQGTNLAVFYSLNPVTCNFWSTLLPFVNILGLDHHLGAVNLAHSWVCPNHVMIAMFAVIGPISCIGQYVTIIWYHSTTVAIVGKIFCWIKTNCRCHTLSHTVITQPMLCGIFNYYSSISNSIYVT